MSVPGPFEDYSVDVIEAWIDYNGHLNDAAYGVIFSAANEALFESLDLSAAYRDRTGFSLYTVECHIRYRAEVARERVRASTRVVEVRDKSVRVRTTLLREDGVGAADAEHVYVHVDGATSRATAFDEHTRSRLEHLVAPDETT